MLRQKIITIATTILAIFLGLLGQLHTPAFAATASNGNGLRISPVRSDLIIAPGHSQTVEVFVQNVTGSTANLQVLVNDFVAGTDETGTPKILLNNQPAPSHSLKQFVSPIPNINITPNQIKEVKVSINIPLNTAGGGYYGVVRFQPTSSGNNGNVSLAASVGSLILVTVPGNIVDNMTIASFDARTITTDKSGQTHESTGTIFTSTKNINAVVRFNNQGNVQEQPFGKIQLKNHSGKVLATYDFNNSIPRDSVLPGSIRKFAVPLTHLGSFGIYTLVGNFGYGTKGQLLTAKTTFYIIPIWFILLVVLIIVLIILGIIYIPRMIRAYNRKVIRKAGRR